MKLCKLFLLSLIYVIPCFAQDIRAIKKNDSFEEVARIDKLEQIRVTQPPTTTYTPKNLKKQQILEFQGRNNTDGSMTVWSTTIADYDTKIVESQQDENDYYIIDNTGKKFKTGEHTDLTPINSTVNQINQQVETNTQSIETVAQRVDQTNWDIEGLNHRYDRLNHRLNSGLASVAALSSLKSNPRSCAKGELAVGVGMYRDKTAVATGLMYHVNDDIMVHGGIGYGGRHSTTGYGGATFSLF